MGASAAPPMACVIGARGGFCTGEGGRQTRWHAMRSAPIAPRAVAPACIQFGPAVLGRGFIGQHAQGVFPVVVAGHGGGLDRDQAVQRRIGQHKAADVLAEVAGRAFKLGGQFKPQMRLRS